MKQHSGDHCSNLIRRAVTLVLCILSIALPSRAGKPPKDLPVTSSLEEGGPSPATIRNDGLGPYFNGDQSVESVLQGIGDWILDTGLSLSNPGRRIFVDLRDPVDGIGANRPFDSAFLASRLIAKSSLVTSGGIRSMRGQGSYLISPLAITFNFEGVAYGLRMNPLYHPGTDFVLVTCTEVAGDQNDPDSPCIAWRMVPDGYSQPKGVARLIKSTTIKGKTVITELGDFYVFFVITFTNP